MEKLLEDYGLKVANVVDLHGLAVESMENRVFKNVGLKGLARVVLGKEIDKPRSGTLSRWDNEWLTYDQVQYACIDAFLSSFGPVILQGKSTFSNKNAKTNVFGLAILKKLHF